MVIVEVRGNDVVNVINGKRRLNIEIQAHGSAAAIDSKTNKEVTVIKDDFGNLKLKQ